MGMFDTFVADCPHCYKEQKIQSKSFVCRLRYFEIGDWVTGAWQPNLEFEEECNDCDSKITFIIREGRFVGFK